MTKFVIYMFFIQYLPISVGVRQRKALAADDPLLDIVNLFHDLEDYIIQF